MHVLSKSSAAALVLAFLVAGCRSKDSSFTTWESYLGDNSRSHYSSIDQINRNNVHDLQVAWVFNTGDAREEGRSQIQCNPIVIDTVLYGTSPRLKLFALHAGNGTEIWRFEPTADADQGGTGPRGVNRGVVYWSHGDDARLFYVVGAYLYAVDARTGQLVTSFGQNGTIDLHNGLDHEVDDLFISATSPGVVYRDLLILGTRVSEGADAAPGHIRAFDVRTGKRRWIFHTVPHPGEFGYDTWPPDAWKTVGGANSWAGMSVDEERGWVFIPTGSASFDFYGGNRPGENLFANSVLVLNATTGERIWHFQTVHHDIWDRDLPAPPNLVRVEQGGRMRDAVAQITKSGYVFLLDRETGEPLFPVKERPVPTSDLLGEQTWPTQPFPTKPPPFARQSFTQDDVTNISPESHAAVSARLAQVRSGGQFVPPSEEGTIIFPGFDGGAEWGGASFDPETGLLYVNSNEMPWILTMVHITPESEQRASAAGKLIFMTRCASCHGVDRKGDANQIFPSLIGLENRRTQAQVSETLERGKG
ncbi:MAG: pyrroloquinoline quinone-dependent dehydrogenase, partial [Rhodothermia bacterium]|nr:pyrroloquinoline quinone-dependent dehydrogenase [Rhodothermia bacterium]